MSKALKVEAKQVDRLAIREERHKQWKEKKERVEKKEEKSVDSVNIPYFLFIYVNVVIPQNGKSRSSS